MAALFIGIGIEEAEKLEAQKETPPERDARLNELHAIELAMLKIEEKSTKKRSLSKHEFSKYMELYHKAVSKMRTPESDAKVVLIDRVYKFSAITNSDVTQSELLDLNVSKVRALLDAGRKLHAKEFLTQQQKILSSLNMSSLTVVQQSKVKYGFYKVYYEYYIHKYVMKEAKMLQYGMSMLNFQLTAGLHSDGLKDIFLVEIYRVTQSFIHIRAFSQSHYLIRACKILINMIVGHPQVGELSQYSRAAGGAENMMNYLKDMLLTLHMSKLLLTMKQIAVAEVKTAKGETLTKEEQKCGNFLTDVVTFERIGVPAEDTENKMLDGLLEDEAQIKLVYGQAVELLKASKQSKCYIEFDYEWCKSTLKEVGEFYEFTD